MIQRPNPTIQLFLDVGRFSFAQTHGSSIVWMRWNSESPERYSQRTPGSVVTTTTALYPCPSFAVAGMAQTWRYVWLISKVLSHDNYHLPFFGFRGLWVGPSCPPERLKFIIINAWIFFGHTIMSEHWSIGWHPWTVGVCPNISTGHRFPYETWPFGGYTAVYPIFQTHPRSRPCVECSATCDLTTRSCEHVSRYTWLRLPDLARGISPLEFGRPRLDPPARPEEINGLGQELVECRWLRCTWEGDSASKSNMLSGRSFVLISCYIQQFMAGKWSLNQTQELNRCGDSGTKYPGSCKLMYCKWKAAICSGCVTQPGTYQFKDARGV